VVAGAARAAYNPGMRLAYALVALAACGGTQPAANTPVPGSGADPATAEPSPLAAEAVAGVDHPALRELLRDDWEWRMRRSPTWATTLGDHRYDDRLGDNSYQAIEAERAQRRALLERARGIDPAALGPGEAITLALYTQDLEAAIAGEVCEFPLWTISARGNPVTSLNYLPEMHPLETAADGDNLIARYRQAPSTVDNEIANLRRGLAAGMAANAESVRRTIELAAGQLARPLDEWALVEPAGRALAGWSEAEKQDFARRLRTAVEEGIAPAYRRYHDFLVSEVLPAARPPERAGLLGLPQGQACYRARIASYVGLPRTAEELHALGVAEIERINAEMRVLGSRLFGEGELPAILERLRTDPALYYDDEEQIMADARRAVDAARAAMPDWFGTLPKAEVVVVPVPDYEAPYTTIAYYRQPHYDGSKPGEYFVNTYQPKTRPRFEIEVLSFHEAIPGHHLQIAISQELGDLPLLRKLDGNTAFVEGWGLYTERLADEMGLYSGDLDRMGMLSYDAWRAARLVVDTGVHALGWTRERAEQFMREHTALTENNISNEVDRYLSWPAQALAYKVGQLEILRLRDEARAALGDRFDIRAFHDVVLKNGAVTLPVLAEQVQAWMIAQRR
jgi:uncharacterized protein (DUF885 family)